MMRDGLLFQEIDGRLNDADHRDDRRYLQLKGAIARSPSDVTPQPDAALRALKSLPWAPGDEAFSSSQHARATLLAAL